MSETDVARFLFRSPETMFCNPEKALTRDLQEMRLAAQVDRQFSRRQLLTIAANRYYFGDGGTGVQTAARYFLHKNPGELNIAEAALLAGMVKAPSYFSPEKHSDRALRRRNDVIDAMVKEGRVTAAEGEAAKASSLRTASDVERVEKPSLHGDRRELSDWGARRARERRKNTRTWAPSTIKATFPQRIPFRVCACRKNTRSFDFVRRAPHFAQDDNDCWWKTRE